MTTAYKRDILPRRADSAAGVAVCNMERKNAKVYVFPDSFNKKNAGAFILL
jgi:hypothetical protein